MSNTCTKIQWEQRKRIIEDELENDPGVPTHTLARKLTETYPEFFGTLESARSAVRYRRGETGKIHRKSTKIEKPNKKRRVNTPIGNIVPENDSPPEIVKPYNLKLAGHGAIISDVHIPYHNQKALQTSLEHSDKLGAMDWILINGDYMDFYQASRWSRNPKSRDIIGELEMAVGFLMDLSKYYGRIILKMGNHEKRFQDYLFANAPEIANMKCLSFPDLFKAHELGIEIVMPQQVMRVGKYLTILHGHEFGRSVFNPVNPARGAFLRAKDNCIVSHHHQVSEHTEKNIQGVLTSTWSTGCLSSLKPPYMPINNWSHGFMTMHVEKNDFEVSNHRILESGKVR